jgi:hypothetical protein
MALYNSPGLETRAEALLKQLEATIPAHLSLDWHLRARDSTIAQLFRPRFPRPARDFLRATPADLRATLESRPANVEYIDRLLDCNGAVPTLEEDNNVAFRYLELVGVSVSVKEVVV